MKRIIGSLLAGFLAMPNIALGGGEPSSLGARSFGLAHASVALEDEWALFNNIAGINTLRKITSVFACQNLYGIPSLNQAAFGMAFPYQNLVWGVGFCKSGDLYYHETMVGVGGAHRIRNVSLGIKVNYHQIGIHETGSKRNLIVEFGGIAEISKYVSFGAYIYNLNQAKISKEFREFIPVIMKVGISYRPFEKLILNIENEKQIDFKPVFKTGIEYAVIDKVKLRAGISLNPGTNYFGVGFRDKRISIDYAMNTHSALGISQQLSITYILKNKNEK